MLLLNHSNNVSKLTNLIGQALGFDKDELHELTVSGLVHDIGKIKIRSEILYKPFKLSEIEMKIMKKHPSLGANLLVSCGYSNKIVEAVRYHQEKYDGSGYEKGLKGEEIPIFARIIAIADSYEAMVSKRMYTSQMTHTQACKEIEVNRGIMYDPYIANVFLNIIKNEKDVINIMSKHTILEGIEIEKELIQMIAR